MTLIQEFYFVRHGQTDHNLLEGKEKGDHTGGIPLNERGRSQAAAIEPIIASLPIQTICFSPMIRAKETKEIATPRLLAPHHEVEELGECTALTWRQMSQLGMYSVAEHEDPARQFIGRVHKGLEHALSLPGPALIVAHGGVHWAICWLLQIEDHSWSIENCGIAHFTLGPDAKWRAQKLAMTPI